MLGGQAFCDAATLLVYGDCPVWGEETDARITGNRLAAACYHVFVAVLLGIDDVILVFLYLVGQQPGNVVELEVPDAITEQEFIRIVEIQRTCYLLQYLVVIYDTDIFQISLARFGAV